MSSLVSEYLFNPLVRQARRFSPGPGAPESQVDIACAEASQQPPSSGQRVWNSLENASVCEDTEPTTGDTTIEERDGSSQAAPHAAVPSMPAVSEVANQRQGALAEQGSPRSMDYQGTSASSVLQMTAPGHHSQDAGAVAVAVAVAGRTVLPEDDGMGVLRQRILAIQLREDIQQEDKARMMHSLLMEGYNRSRVTSTVHQRPVSASGPVMPEQARTKGALEMALSFLNNLGDQPGAVPIHVTDEDRQPTFVPEPSEPSAAELSEGRAPAAGRGSDHTVDAEAHSKLGCEHYQRKVKMQCATCERWYTCRLCHDKVEDHILPRKATRHMLCMLCGCAQRVGSTCTNCGATAGRYYCDVCKLWNDDPDKPIYHCDKCGICRVGHGLGRDFFHCDKCMACIAIKIAKSHKCIERSLDSDCPICGDYMFSSRAKVVFMSCGHSIHHACYEEHIKTSYKCPICYKSVTNMDMQFRLYHAAVLNQPMPPEYADTRAIISCNDCSAKSQTKYHWLGLRCSICQSYNTVPLQILNAPKNATLPDSQIIGAGPDGALLSSAARVGALTGASTNGIVPDRGGPAMQASERLSPPTLLPPSLPVPPMDIPRGFTGTRPGTSTGQEVEPPSFSPYVIPDRIARSVSPIPTIGGREEDDEEREAREFWGGDANGNILPTSGGETDDDESEDDKSDSEDEEDADIDEDEDDEDDIQLFGHR